MHLNRVRVASLTMLLLAGCGDTTRAGAPVQLAGGESSEFSGGDVALGFCPVELSHTPLDLEREDVAMWVALVEGHHEVPLRWRRELPKGKIRGFDERTVLSLDLTPISAEDVVCGNGGYGGYEVEGLDGRVLRRFELAVELSTADGAIRAAFQQRFFSVPSGGFEQALRLEGSSVLPFEEVGGTLELGVDPELETDTQALEVQLSFDAQSVHGSLTPRVSVTGPLVGDDTPRWAPVTGLFPAPDEGCELGTSVPLDTRLELLGATPRAAYDTARSRLPSGPITAAWRDALDAPGSLTWTDVTLRAGSADHACLNGASVDVYTSLRIESADGALAAEPSVITTVDRLGSWAMSAGVGWAPSEEFLASAGIRDLDLSLAEYAAFSLYQTFGEHDDGETLQGELGVAAWQEYHARAASPVLRWCAGARCAAYWCSLTATDGGASCF
jgi:hypothetical protein